MRTKPDPTAAPAVEACPAVRLATSELVAVDRCNCGVLRVHLGAITLRVTPEGLHAIIHTLGEALVADRGQCARRSDSPRALAAITSGPLAATKGQRGQS